jgi:hypothetical protein
MGKLFPGGSQVLDPFTDNIWGGENRSISDDFGNETDTTFVPCCCLAPKGLRRNPNRHVCLKNMNFRHPQITSLKARLSVVSVGL